MPVFPEGTEDGGKGRAANPAVHGQRGQQAHRLRGDGGSGVFCGIENGQTGVQIQAYFGSSQYDTKQMSRLIDGIIYEARELGIETATPEEVALMKSRWGNAQADKIA